MRAIDSAIRMCRKYRRPLEIIWFKDHALNATFSSLFEPLREEGVTLREARGVDYLLYDRPRRKNLHLPALFQRLMFRHRLYERDAALCDKRKADFPIFEQPGSVYIASCYQMTALPGDFQCFVPAAAIRDRIDAYDLNDFVGVHIRRGDNEVSISRSPDTLFREEMERELYDGGCRGFYLATDSAQVKDHFKSHFKERLLLSPKTANRLDAAGMQDAVMELYLLSKTKKIIGSAGSSFSETAAYIRDIPFVRIEK